MRNKILSSALCVLLCVLIFVFSACSTSKPIESSEEELRVVGTVGEFEVLYEELRFLVLTYKEMLIDTYGEDVLSDPETASKYEAEIRDYVYKNITANYAVLKMCREVGIESDEEALSNAVQKDIEDTIKSLGGRRKYKAFLKESFMTDNFFRFNVRIDKMRNELFYVYTDDLGLIETENEKIYDIITRDFIKTQHIYISKSNGKSYDENLALINELYSRLNNGEDFFSLAESFGEDDELTSDGFYITKGYMSDTYEDIAFSLGKNQISGVIEDNGGFYIIKRFELDNLYVMMNFDTLSDRYQQYTFIEMIDDTQKELEFIPNDYLNSISMLNIE